MKKVALLGCSGEIGKKTLQVARHLKEEIEIVALAAQSNCDLVYEQAIEFSPKLIALYDKEAASHLQKKLPTISVLAGIEGLEQVAACSDADFIMLAIPGNVALLPTVAAIRAGKQLGLANKEVLVSGGKFLCNLAKKHRCELIPVDSEHSAIHQCLRAGKKREVKRLILTASGGALRNKSFEELKYVTLQETLMHPNWKAGPKALIDCATLINKGLEMIAASYLFDLQPDQIDAVIHPESIIHSFVEFIDGSLLAQMGNPDMVSPIQYAITYPERKKGMNVPFDFMSHSSLHFFPPDKKKISLSFFSHFRFKRRLKLSLFFKCRK